MATPDELIAKYSSGGSQPADTNSSGIDVDGLINKYSGIETQPALTPTKNNVIVPPPKLPLADMGAGAVQGVKNVANAGSSAIGAADEALIPGGADRNRLFKDKVQKSNTAYENKYGENTEAKIGETIGEVAATAPFVPARAIDAYMGAKASAPVVNRLLGAVGKGAFGGGEFGAATSTSPSNKNSLDENIASGIITGAIAGPVLEGAGKLSDKTMQGIKSLWANADIQKLAASANMPASAVKNIVQTLQDAGLSPQQAQIELNKLGPKATLMDLDRALAAEGGGLAAAGGKATSIIKGRMDARAETANSDATKLFESKFGPKPNLEAEKNAVHKEAQRLTSADYNAAHASTNKLDISSTVTDIDKALENAAGRKATALKEVKGYLFKDVKDPATGEVKKVLRSDVASLHETRQAIDDLINTRGDALPSNALSAVQNIRDKVDIALKTNPQMAAADAKFAKHMDVKNGIDYGYQTITKGNVNKEEFAKAFDAAALEVQEGIKKGLRAATGDIMEKSSQGELTGASRIFDKKAVNRSNFKKAFGSDADEVLDALHQEIAFRNTERGIISRSHTAEGQAIQQKYGLRDKPSGAFAEGAKGAALDVVAGTPGLIALGRGAMAAGKNKLVELSGNRLGQYIEGSADIISRSGPERDAAVSVLSRVKAIQDKSAKPSRLSGVRLPVSAAAPIGEESYDQFKQRFKNF